MKDNLRTRLAEFWGLQPGQIANPTSELQLIIGQEHTSLTPTKVKKYVPPENSPEISLVESVLVKELMLEGVAGLDEEMVEEPVKNAAELLGKFLEAEGDIKIANKCSNCEIIKCPDCKYQSTQLSINDALINIFVICRCVVSNSMW